MQNLRKIPATMASQHPDHAGIPYWQKQAFIDTRQEAEECYLSFSDLGISEYKWDWEGKFVDESVTERLLSSDYNYFSKQQLGKDKFLTFRLPNPKVETEFRVGRAFMGLLSAAVFAKKIGLFSPPLFEVILPMTETAEEMIAIQEAYQEIAHLRHPLFRSEENPLTSLYVIPLFEEVHTIIRSDEILSKYVHLYKKQFGRNPRYIRPYVARSDPALNAGIVPTVLAIKIALSKYYQFADKTGIPQFPIIGCAALGFRGGLTPYTIQNFVKQYAGIRTTLIQSAFRYDYPKKDVIKGIKLLEKLLPQQTVQQVSASDEKVIETIIPFFEKSYQSTVEKTAPIINEISSQLPKRRERVQHIGLFGYSRGVGKVKLPRAIGFTAAMYSIGLPPEIIGTGRGLKKVSDKELKTIEKYYINLTTELETAGRFVNKEVVAHLAKKKKIDQSVLEDIKAVEDYLGKNLEPKTLEEKEHHLAVEKIYQSYINKKLVTEFIEQAALLRRSMG